MAIDYFNIWLPAEKIHKNEQFLNSHISETMHIFKIARALLIFFSCGYLTYLATTGLQSVITGEIGYLRLCFQIGNYAILCLWIVAKFNILKLKICLKDKISKKDRSYVI